MEFKVGLIFLLLALTAAVAQSSTIANELNWVISVEDFIGEENEMLMDSEESRRILAAAKRYISYGALKANKVPCGRRGSSYYNCQRRQKANPYRRGCNAITRCARYTD